jgi:guanylate kinase
MPAKRHEAKIFIISAPSGSGKTTLCRKLIRDKKDLFRSVSVTTRRPRPAERNGKDYHFITKARFKEMIKDKAFLEYEDNFGNFYGTPREPVDKAIGEGRDVLLSIDVKGAMKVKRAYPDKSALIFILPPSMAVLKRRLHLRMADAKAAMAKRLKIAEREMSYKGRYDYRIVNDNLETAYRKLKGIIREEQR